MNHRVVCRHMCDANNSVCYICHHCSQRKDRHGDTG